MHTAYRIILLAFSWAAGTAAAEGGLSVSLEQTPWPRWQARVGLAASPTANSEFAGVSGQHLSGAKLLGDYYFAGPGFGGNDVAGGFRATSGVVFGRHALLLGIAQLGTPRGISLAVSRSPALAFNGTAEAPDSAATAPYLGVGYTSLSARGGWGFSADIGLLMQSPGNGLRVNAADAQNSRSFDDVMHDWRLTPLVQLGVSYSF